LVSAPRLNPAIQGVDFDLVIAPGFAGLWTSAWLTAWLVAFPVVLLVAPLARKAVERLTTQ
jgi:hypothetical protein